MVKKTITNLNAELASVNGVSIGELEPISTSQIKDTDLFAIETDLTTNSISVSQVKEVVSNELLSYTNNKLGSIIFHPAPAGYQNIPVETNGFGDAILVADGRLLDKADYPDMWNFIKTRKEKNIYGFNGETLESFKIDDLTNKITLPNLLSGKAVYMGNYGVQDAIFPQHTFTSGNITPTTQPHNHNYSYMGLQQGGNGTSGSGYRFVYPTNTTSSTTVVINPFTVSSSSISNLPAGVTVGTDYKVAGVKMIPCIVCKPTYEINAGGGGSGGGVATEDLNMNLFKITNLGVPLSDSDAVRLVDLKLDNNKILYKKNGDGGYDSLQSSMDILFILTENSVNKKTGLMDSSYDITTITQPKNVITLEYLENSNTISGYVKKDRSIELTGTGTFNTKQITAMDDLKDSNIIITDEARVVTTLKSKLIDMDSKITALESNEDAFKVAQSRRLVKPNTDIITILGQGRLFPIDTFTPTTAAGYESDTFTIETLNGKKVIKEKMNNGVKTRHLNIRLSLGHTTTMANKKVELAVFLFRGGQTGLDDNSAIATGSSMLFYDTDTRGQSTNLLSVVVNGVDDKFVTEGFFIVLKSLNQSSPNPDSEKLIFTKGDILINIVNSK
jgi:hypothetical protein